MRLFLRTLPLSVALAVGGASLSAQGPLLPLAAKAATMDEGARDEEGKSPLVPVGAALQQGLSPLGDSAYPPRPTRKDERMSKAEAMFEEGRRLYRAGKMEEARALFDEALDQVLNSRAEPVDRLRFDKRFEELVQKIYRLDLEGLGASQPAEQPGFDKAPIDDILSLTFPVDPKMSRMVREEVAATVSQLPLEASDAVLSFINYFAGERGKRTLLAGLRRSGRYRPMISRILDEEGIPQEFIFLAQAESGFLPRAVSYMSAGGMWQFVRGRGSEYGLRQDAYVDERFDPELATRAAARHLRDLYHQFGDWYLAIAAYNCGPGNVDRAVERTGYADVWELRSRGVLPLETSNYVPIILAMTIMSKNPKNYGLDEVVFEEPIQYDTVEMTANTNLSLVADLTGQPVSELRDLNPALLKDVAPSGYRLHVPKGSLVSLMAGLEMVPEARRQSWRAHRAPEAVETAEIARRFNVTPVALQSANPGLGTSVGAGALVVVPAAAPAPAPVRRAATRSTPAARGKSSASVKSTSRKSTASVKTSSRRPATAARSHAAASSKTRPAPTVQKASKTGKSTSRSRASHG